MKIGFIGVGTIASAIVKGFCMNGDTGHEIYLSPRNKEKAAALAEQFPNVSVCMTNQEVLDRAELVVLAVIPKQAEGILSELTFRPEHKVVSFMSDFPVERIKGVIGDVEKIVRVLPLPFAAMCVGPVVVYPADEEIRKVFSKVGNVIGIEEEDKMEIMLGITGVMSAFYGLTDAIVCWGENAGLTKEESSGYVTAFFEALSVQAGKTADINALANEYTPGGLNEMGLVKIRDERQAYDAWSEALDDILARLQKK